MARKQSGKSEMRRIIAEWAKAHADASGLSDETIGDRIGLTRDQFNKLKNGKRRALWEEVAQLSQLFRTEPPTHLSLEGTVPVRKFISLRNSVAAGVWLETTKLMIIPKKIDVGVLPGQAFQQLEHYARRVEDGHADLVVPQGYYVICVNYHDARKSLNHGDTVVIQRNRRDLSSEDSFVSELSIRKLIRGDDDKWILSGLCSIPHLVADIPYAGDTDEIKIIDLIVNSVGMVTVA